MRSAKVRARATFTMRIRTSATSRRWGEGGLPRHKSGASTGQGYAARCPTSNVFHRLLARSGSIVLCAVSEDLVLSDDPTASITRYSVPVHIYISLDLHLRDGKPAFPRTQLTSTSPRHINVPRRNQLPTFRSVPQPCQCSVSRP